MPASVLPCETNTKCLTPTMKKIHLLAIACASALPITTTSAQSCNSGYGGYRSGYSSNYHRGHSSYRSHYKSNYGGYRANYRSHRSHGSDHIRLISGYQHGKSIRPKGWHTRSWYAHHGYKLDNYAYAYRHSGSVYHVKRHVKHHVKRHVKHHGKHHRKHHGHSRH